MTDNPPPKPSLGPSKTVDPPKRVVSSSQNASTTIEGWNDCPILPNARPSSRSSSRSRRTPSYVSFLDATRSPQQSQQSSRSGSLPPSRNQSWASLARDVINDATPTADDVQRQLEALFAQPSKLTARELDNYKSMFDPEVLASSDNRVLISTVLNDKSSADHAILEFTQSRRGVGWCIALHKVVKAVVA